MWKKVINHSTTDPLKHTLIDVASRTYQIAEVTIPSGSAAGTDVFTHNPGDMFTDIINISNKVTGFLCAHANVCYEIRYNVEPQAVGGICLYQLYTQAKSTNEATILNGNQTLFSGLSTVINLLTETSSTFTVKYVSNSMTYSYNASSPSSESGFWPNFKIKVWSSYVSPTNTDLRLTIYARLCDLTLMIPTIPDIIPPSGLQDLASLYKTIQQEMNYKMNKDDVYYSLGKIMDRFGGFDVMKAQTGADKELKQETKGWFSETVTKGNQFIQSIPSVPVIKQIKEVAAITLPTVANLARYFGFSKPEDHKIGKAVEQLNAINMNNIDGASHSYNLANSAHQRRAVESNAKDQVLSLGIVDFASRPAYIDRFRIERTTPANSVLWSYDVSPYRMCRRVTANSIAPTPLGFSSLFFKYWRGDIIFRFRFFANQFVNYNVQIATVYGMNAGSITDVTDMSNVYNYIYDGKALTTVDYRVDYKSQNPWKKTNSHLLDFVDPATSIETVGSIVVRLQNALTSSSSTVDGIDVTVEVFGAENMEFNVARHVPYSTSPAMMIGRNLETMKAQINADATAVASDERHVDASIKEERLDTTADTMTFGQSIKSFKQLLNIEQFLGIDILDFPAPAGSGNILGFYPYNYALTPQDVTDDSMDRNNNYLKLITQPFAFVSGELLYSFMSNSSSPLDGSLAVCKFDVELLPQTADVQRRGKIIYDSQTGQTRSWLTNLDSNILPQRTLQSRIVVKPPNYFARTAFVRPNSDTQIQTGMDRQWYPEGLLAYGFLPSADPGAQGYNIPVYTYVRGADNFNLHMFNGLCYLYFGTDTSSQSPAVIPPPD